jgi:ABC-2 type transport system permease protein
MMEAFLYGILLQWKLDLRNKGALLTYYVVPLMFFGFVGKIFTSIMPETKSILIYSMSIFGITMGSILGTPIPIVETYGSRLKKAYQIGGIPIYIPVITNLISAFVHLFIMSTIICFVAPLAFDVSMPTNMAVHFIILAIFIITSLSIAVVLGLIIKSATKLTMISQFIFLPSLMLSGIMFPAEMLPTAFSNAGKVLPATWGFQMLKTNALNFKLLLPLLAIIIICVSVSAWRIRILRVE